MLRRIAVALEMLHIRHDRSFALGYLFGRHALAEWEEDLILAPPRMLEEGPTEVSGIAAEAECPATHWELERGGACHWCRAAV